MFPMDQAINPSDDAVQIDDDVVPHRMRVFLKAGTTAPLKSLSTGVHSHLILN